MKITDEQLAEWWRRLGNISVDDAGILQEDFDIPEEQQYWEKGTDREIVWKWFDMHHSKGVYALMITP